MLQRCVAWRHHGLVAVPAMGPRSLAAAAKRGRLPLLRASRPRPPPCDITPRGWPGIRLREVCTHSRTRHGTLRPDAITLADARCVAVAAAAGLRPGSPVPSPGSDASLRRGDLPAASAAPSTLTHARIARRTRWPDTKPPTLHAAAPPTVHVNHAPVSANSRRNVRLSIATGQQLSWTPRQHGRALHTSSHRTAFMLSYLPAPDIGIPADFLRPLAVAVRPCHTQSLHDSYHLALLATMSRSSQRFLGATSIAMCRAELLRGHTSNAVESRTSRFTVLCGFRSSGLIASTRHVAHHDVAGCKTYRLSHKPSIAYSRHHRSV